MLIKTGSKQLLMPSAEKVHVARNRVAIIERDEIIYCVLGHTVADLKEHLCHNIATSVVKLFTRLRTEHEVETCWRHESLVAEVEDECRTCFRVQRAELDVFYRETTSVSFA